MPVIEARVAVDESVEPGATFIDNVGVTTAVGAVKRQVGVVGDPENPAARQAVRNGKPGVTDWGAVVRVAPDNFDSGLIDVPAGGVNLAVADTDVAVIVVCNLTDQVQPIVITDGNNKPYLSNYPMQPREAKPFPFGGIRFANGVKAQAAVDSALSAQVRGNQ